MFVDGWLALSKPEGNGFQSDIGRQWRIPRAECRWVGFDYKVRGVRGNAVLYWAGFSAEREREWFIQRCRENSAFAPSCLPLRRWCGGTWRCGLVYR